MKLYIYILIALLTLISCNGQNNSNRKNPAKQIGTEVSELSKNILIVFQANNGDYWFGSDVDGVYRFDGRILLHFTTENGLSGNRIRSIQEDQLGNIYLSTLEGISKFDGQKFTTLNAIKSNSPNENWELNADHLWFSMPGKNGDKGPYRYDGKNLYQLEFPENSMADEYFANNPTYAWSPYEVYSIYEDSEGNMWFGTSGFGVCRYDGKSFLWLYEEHLTKIEGGGSFGVRSIIEDQEGKFWFSNTLYRYDISANPTVEQDKLNYQRENGIDNLISTDGKNLVYFMSVVEDNNGDLWMATYNQGVWRYDGKNVQQYAVKNGSQDVTLFSIYKDKKGKLLLGTHDSGVFQFNGESFEQLKF